MNDIDGSPLLILTLEDAKNLWEVSYLLPGFLTDRELETYRKIEKFLEENNAS